MSNKYLHFSVLMSVYDRESPHYLKLALASIFSQTLLPSEIVLVKDGPINQDLDMVINSFVDQRKIKFLLIQNPHNMGLSYSLQKGLLASNYDVVARMDTDDIAYPSRFERQMEYFISNNVDIVGSYATKISSDGIEKGLLKVPIDNNSIHQLIWTCPFIHPTVMFLKKSVLNAGGYSDKAGPRQDDYDLWFRCANMRYTFANIAEPLVYYRFFDDSVQKNSIKVGWARLKVGFKGAYKLRLPFIAYIGVSLPLIRSLLPFPLNVYFNSLMARVNPRNK